MVSCTFTAGTEANNNRKKKRKINMVKWKKNVAKHLRNSGQEYVSIRTDNVIPAVQLPQMVFTLQIVQLLL